MGQENVEIVRRFYEVWNGAGSPDQLLGFIAEDFEYVNPPNAVEPGTRHGTEGLLMAMASLGDAFDEYENDPTELIDLGERVLAWVMFRARAKQGGLRYEKLEAQLWTLRGGKIVRVQWFHDRAEALEAAGLSE